MAEDSSEIVREVAESVSATNLKVLADGPAFYSNLAMGNSVSAQHGMNQISAAIIGKVAEAIIGVSPSEGGADVAALQQLMKGAALTPPVTAKPIE